MWNWFALFTIALIAFILMRMAPKSASEAINGVVGYVAGFALIAILAIFVAPWVVRHFPDWLKSQWGGVVSQYTPGLSQVSDELGAMLDVRIEDDGTGISEIDAVLTQYATTAVPAVAPTSLPSTPTPVPQVVVASGVVTQSASLEPTPIPAPTAVPTPDVTPLLEQLRTARLTGDRVGGRVLIDQILAVSPADTVALALNEELRVANIRATQLQELGLRDGAGFMYDNSKAMEVDARLSGLAFYVVSVETYPFFPKTTEPATVEVVSDGWLKGVRFVASRAHLARHSCSSAGCTFLGGGQ